MMVKRYIRLILSLLGIAGIVAYLFFPNEKEIECFDKDSLEFNPYIDSASGIVFADVEPFAFRCGLSKENGNCGMGFSFGKKNNWNLVDSLVLEIQSSPNFEELIVQVLTFDPDNTKQNDRSTFKPFIKELKLEPGKERYSIAMRHFYVPDYWFTQQNAKNTHNAKKFFAVTGMDIFSGWKNPTNSELELKINSICTEEFSNAPFVVLVIYIGILIAIAISVRIKT